MEKKTNAPITPIRPLPGDSAPLGVNTTATRGGNGSHSRGGGVSVRKHTSPVKSKNPEGENRLGQGPKYPPWRTTVLNLDFQPRPLVIGAHVGVGLEFVQGRKIGVYSVGSQAREFFPEM